MNGTLSDACGVLIATLLAVPLVLLPGYALGAITGVLGFRALPAGRRALGAALLGIALLPALDALLIQAAGLPAAALANVVLGLAALRPTIRDLPRPVDWPAVALAALWLAIVTYALIDIDTGAALHQPLTVIDLVKHGALTRAIVAHGLPPVDPFFARPERAGYYYYFYTLTALVDWTGGRLVDGRTAFAGLAFWTGIALLGLLDRLLAATGLVREVPTRLLRRTVLVLLPAGGLDILLVLLYRATSGFWLPIPEWLNEQHINWAASLVWVPHHVAAALAGWLGLLVLAELADRNRPGRRAEAAGILTAGTAFAACAGLSVWVCLGTAAGAGLWLALLGFERRWRAAARLGAAGIVSLVLAAPYLLSVVANRSDTGSSIRFAIRRFGPLERLFDEPTLGLLEFVLLPVNYYVSLGVFAGGALLFWRIVPRREAHAREAGRLLTICAAVSLLLGGFVSSAILNNDLGSRVVLLAQIATFVWTAVALTRTAAGTRLRFAGSLGVLLILGYATTLYGFAGLRAYPASHHPKFAFFNGRPEIDRALRAAYGWAGTNLPRDLVLQGAPSAPRVFDFGLYGEQPVAVADHEARLFGAPPEAVAARLAAVAPIFDANLTGAEVHRRAAEAGIGALVVTAADAPWGEPGSWVWRTRPAYADTLVRILRVEDLDE
ncbi:hypothetical protein SAMN05216360_11310 [Methylobacterium phyllostachyos]|uniref:Chlor_Arch_YYY domain-containing protein n=1 Tax=Methylobacterium phyllostachyos TaxID=582672 RepID=A0A1H0FM27_9HYPH|nr:hypothetical protein [Methylobacterium phyllostachyos]SDN95715.1 hypothetical protein SAMN05216360_11310 [Methylobacterium phyllostachyos]